MTTDWRIWAILSAVFATATALLAKVAVAAVPSHLATAIRTTVALVLAWSVAAFARQLPALQETSAQSIGLLVLSGLATGASWLCYFRALQLGPLSKVAPVDKLSLPLVLLCAALILGEKLSWREILGVACILGGTYLVISR